MARISQEATSLLDKIIDALLAETPNSLGFPGPGTQSAYYPGPETITKDEITAIAEIMEKNSIEPENTRLRKSVDEGAPVFHILQASVENSSAPTELDGGDPGLITVRVVPGDHAAELSRVCAALGEAAKYASNDTQVTVLNEYIQSFTTGSTEAYRRSQKAWVTDLSPSVESVFGFVELYWDPYGVRAEWEGIVPISDPDETRKLAGLVNDSAKVISLLPWASEENDGKGPFEASLFRAPDFTIVHGEFSFPPSPLPCSTERPRVLLQRALSVSVMCLFQSLWRLSCLGWCQRAFWTTANTDSARVLRERCLGWCQSAERMYVSGLSITEDCLEPLFQQRRSLLTTL